MAKELLQDVTIRNAKPIDKDKRLNDGSGLYLLIKPNGAKWWRFDYTFAGKRKTLSLGFIPIPDLTMPDAKQRSPRQCCQRHRPQRHRKEIKADQS